MLCVKGATKEDRVSNNTSAFIDLIYQAFDSTNLTSLWETDGLCNNFITTNVFVYVWLPGGKLTVYVRAYDDYNYVCMYLIRATLFV